MVHGSLLFISWDWGTSLQCFGGGNPLQPGGEKPIGLCFPLQV